MTNELSYQMLFETVQSVVQMTDVQYASTKLLSFYVGDLLTMGQISNGAFRKSITTFSLKVALENVFLVTKEKVESKGISIIREFTNCNYQTEITTDMMRLQQVLLNYLSNAIKFTPEDGTIRICCSFRSSVDINENDRLEIEVIDTGIGISEEDQ